LLGINVIERNCSDYKYVEIFTHRVGIIIIIIIIIIINYPWWHLNTEMKEPKMEHYNILNTNRCCEKYEHLRRPKEKEIKGGKGKNVIKNTKN
jgi:hypothetical protein